MDHHSVPFPTSQAEEAQNPVKRPAIPPRLHSTPSLPNLWHPSQYGPTSSDLAQQLQARYRPHLRPLDLASSPTSSPSKFKGVPESPRRGPPPLTPPLTPSSSFNSATHDTPPTPPEPHSPLRWIQSSERSFMGSPTNSKPVSFPHAGYLTPSSDERTFSLDVQEYKGINPLPDVLLDEASNESSSRFLLVHNVPPTASSVTLRAAFASMGDIKGILVRFQATHGVVILAFYDVRHAIRAQRQISEQIFDVLEDARLDARFVAPSALESVTGKSAFVAQTDGALYVNVEAHLLQPGNLQNVLASFGELLSFKPAGADPNDQTFHVEYYDVRDAASALKALNNRTIFGARLHLFTAQDSQAQESSDPFQTTGAEKSMLFQAPLPLSADNLHLNSHEQHADIGQRGMEGRVRPRSVSASEGMGTPDAVRKLRKGRESPQEHSRRSSNDLFFDAVGKVIVQPPPPTRPRSISMGPEELAGTARLLQAGAAFVPVAPAYHYAEHPYGYGYPGVETDAGANHWAYASPPASGVEYYLPFQQKATVYQHPQAPPTPRNFAEQRRKNETRDIDLTDSAPYALVPGLPSSQPYHASQSSGVDIAPADEDQAAFGKGAGRSAGEKNHLNIASIEEGTDTRTTVMIKNIPNKMSDKDLLAFINKVCPRRIDFMYLRMDFQNGCNVGYAFVNFISVQDLLHFAKTQLGVKWNMYSSEKVLQMCYATYQGKEA
ncbi:Meiosis protein mei2 [Grifola frondosa]|uniref:Meiosis protein mei2 n=1 Tax=Grifola frondosa TaxID=5627 RepID=A0A1C7LRD0_GRIFR|nr:Meiosis protein mei2 [Grifola frondosa]